jgi:hypothetical protein
MIFHLVLVVLLDEKRRLMPKNDESNQRQIQVNIDAKETPVLYCDNFFISSTNYGVTFDFAQQVGPSNQQVVARVGLSFDHARKIIEVIQDHLEKHER